MGLLSDIANDLQMGFGLKDRDKDYYKRTAKTIGKSRGEMAANRYMERMEKSNFPKRGGLLGGMDIDFGAYKNMKDMFDRGGANASGGVFQGGGLLSDIANALFPPTQTSGFGTSAKILGERTNDSGMARPFDPNFYDKYLNEQLYGRIPRDMNYDTYYEKMFP
tara:strand:- start:4032 stop:4523 length:492 start_codon:yes stop_codon:yes gene_type:complete